MLSGKRILLIISGGIAAYKSLELVRLMKKSGADVRCILTKGGAQFVTPLSVAALSGNPVYDDLWSLKDETEMGHIRLSRETDLIVIAPASANIIARIAHGFADDLAATTILASDKPVMVCPSMNPMMWQNPATQDNIETLNRRGLTIITPALGEMACGETGEGRLPEAEELLEKITAFFQSNKPLAGTRAIVTSGPTFEAIDPVRFIGNRSSGKQGHAIAKALAHLGADVTLITGSVAIPDPDGIKTVHIENAAQMLESCQNALPADIFIAAAAVADWSPETPQKSKMKKGSDTKLTLSLTQNPDILGTVSKSQNRPRLVIGFAAETENLIENAKAKLLKKGCDFIVANAVGDENTVFGSDENKVYFISSQKTEEWPRMGKEDVARRIARRVSEYFEAENVQKAAE
jgi:phosphopantothenoylcysteine decarboxylase/phosphopantothenate--cysteine ligase